MLNKLARSCRIPVACNMRTNLLVIGASGRFLAESASRAGWQVAAIDLFTDQDLRACCHQVLQLEPGQSPAAVVAAARSLPPGPFVFTGGLENKPSLLASLAAERPLAGNGPAQLAAVRNPAAVAAVAAAAGWNFPDTRDCSRGLPTNGSFLRKPYASAGGHSIVRWQAGLPGGDDFYWQRLVPGRASSVSLLLGPHQPQLLGLCRQFIGLSWCHGPRFGFCGGVELPKPGPRTLLWNDLQRLAATLAERGLRGLVGADLILPRTAARQPPTLLEINPRPTATMELIERRIGTSLVAAHLEACGHAGPPQPAAPAARDRCWAKAVLFAAAAVTLTRKVDDQLCRLAVQWRDAGDAGRDWPPLADRPPVGSRIETGRPILTVFAAGRTPVVAARRLRQRTAAVQEVLAPGVD